MKIIYGTGNSAKIMYMKRALEGLPTESPIEIVGLKEAALARGLKLPEPEEGGTTPLENARSKAECYFKLFVSPVFSCDSGLYLWNHHTGEPLPEAEQPGVWVRGRGARRLSDEELLGRYIGLVKTYGLIRARYKNAICLIWNTEIRAESMEEDLWGEEFLLTDTPHPKRVAGFPLDSISIDEKTREYFYDMEGNSQDGIVSTDGFKRFFTCFMEKYQLF